MWITYTYVPQGALRLKRDQVLIISNFILSKTTKKVSKQGGLLASGAMHHEK